MSDHSPRCAVIAGDLPVVTSWQFASVLENPSGSSIGPRILPSWELVWIHTGSAERTVIDARGRRTVLEMPPGSFTVGAPGEYEHYQWDRRHPTHHGWVHFDMTGPGSDGMGAWPSLRSSHDQPLLASIAAQLVDLGADPCPVHRRRHDQLLSMLLATYRDGPVRSLPVPDLIARLVTRIRTCWAAEGIGAGAFPELAAKEAVSAGHAYRVWRTYFGLSPAQSLERVRLTRAAHLLLRTNTTAESIARECGFANPYHFSRRFRSLHSVPPGTFRTASSRDPDLAIHTPELRMLAHRLLP